MPFTRFSRPRVVEQVVWASASDCSMPVTRESTAAIRGRLAVEPSATGYSSKENFGAVSAVSGAGWVRKLPA